jgi:hypothetical protein
MSRDASKILVTIAAVAAISGLVTALACGSADEWTAEEIANAEHMIASLQADRRAAELENLDEPGVEDAKEAEVALEYRERALREARRVRDEVLAKAHPDLLLHFREEHERSLELFIEAHDAGDVGLEREALRLRERFGSWYVAHQREIRIPQL